MVYVSYMFSISRTFHPKATEYTFFLSAHRVFPRIDHMLNHKIFSVNLRRLKSYPRIFLDQCMRLEIKYKEKM